MDERFPVWLQSWTWENEDRLCALRLTLRRRHVSRRHASNGDGGRGEALKRAIARPRIERCIRRWPTSSSFDPTATCSWSSTCRSRRLSCPRIWTFR